MLKAIVKLGVDLDSPILCIIKELEYTRLLARPWPKYMQPPRFARPMTNLLQTQLSILIMNHMDGPES